MENETFTTADGRFRVTRRSNFAWWHRWLAWSTVNPSRRATGRTAEAALARLGVKHKGRPQP